MKNLISYLGVLTAAVLVTVLANSQRALSEARTKGAMAGELAYLDRIRAELLGWPLPEGLTVTSDDGSDIVLDIAIRDASVVWIVDPTECTICGDEARLLNRSVISMYPEVMTVFSGIPAAEARAFAMSWGLRGDLVADPEGAVRRSLGLVLPSSFFVLNQIGNVVHFDAHRGDQSCRNDVLELARRLLESRAGEHSPAPLPLAQESSQ